MTKEYDFDKFTNDGEAIFFALLASVADDVWKDECPPDISITINGTEFNPEYFCNRLAYWLGRIGHEYAATLYKDARVGIMNGVEERMTALEKWMDEEIAKKLELKYDSWEGTFSYRGDEQ